MILSTTPSLEGRPITEYCGIVTGEAILGANVFKDIMAGFRDVVGGRSETYERELRAARDLALKEMSDHAAQVKADAVVGVDIDYEVIGRNGSMLMVCASGTAVKL